MENLNTDWHKGPSKDELKLRKQCTKVHSLLGNRPNIATTANAFVEKINGIIEIDNNSMDEISKFKEYTSGIILTTLQTGKIIDTVPLLSVLGDEILKDTIFYTTKESEHPLTTAFSNNSFRQDTFANDKERKIARLQTVIDTERIELRSGYIFIVPTGDAIGKDAPFRYLTANMIEHANEDLPVLINDINTMGPLTTMGYGDIFNMLKVESKVTSLLRRFGLKTDYYAPQQNLINITSKLLTAGDFKGKNGDESREIFNSHLGI